VARRSGAEFEDKALRILYVAAGFLEWHEADRGQPLRSPLVLVPVELRRKSARDPYRLFFVEDEEPVVNPALAVKLQRDAGLSLDESWDWEDKPIEDEQGGERGAAV
jgi:Protein of unknown function (DUF4011)